jgi:hypothetical protein
MHHVDQEARAVLVDGEAWRRLDSSEHAARAGDPLLRAHAALAPLVHAGRGDRLAERLDECGREARRAGGQELADDEVAVAVRDDPGQAVALAVHQPMGGESLGQRRAAERQRLVEPAADEARVDRLLLERQHADRDRGLRVRVTRGDERAAGGAHLDRLAGSAPSSPDAIAREKIQG